MTLKNLHTQLKVYPNSNFQINFPQRSPFKIKQILLVNRRTGLGHYPSLLNTHKSNLHQNPNRKEILTSADPTKPVHAEEKSVESVEVDISEIEVAEVAEVEVVDTPKPKRSKRKK